MQQPATSKLRFNSRGMTLIEIMVVLVIIGALAATLGKTVWDTLFNANVKNTQLAMNQVSQQLQFYNSVCGTYPTTEQGLNALVTNPGPEACPNWGPKPYLKTELLRDVWQRPFNYESDGSTFTLKSNGPDKRNGGGDDLVVNSEGAAGEAPKN